MNWPMQAIRWGFVLIATVPLAMPGCNNQGGSGTESPLPSVGVATRLHEAAANGNLQTVEDLVREGADINARDESGKTPLHHAAAHGHLQTVGVLLDLGADADALDQDSRTPRDYAESNGHDGTAAQLPARQHPAGGGHSRNRPGDAHPDTPVPPDSVTTQRLKPTLEYASVEAFSSAIAEPACLLVGEHIYFFAPKSREEAANIVFPYLVKAYDILYGITGRHTDYIIIVYNFPKGHRSAYGGTSNCVLYYDDTNLQLDQHEEWREYGIPHVSGYIEEMAHNFVGATRVQFGWEMVGWSIGVKATEAVAGNAIFAKQVEDTRQRQAETFQRYVAGGYVFPADIESNLVDRVHALILWQCEQEYGASFWPDFFREAARHRDTLLESERRYDGDEARNARYQITVDCFDRLPGLRFKERLVGSSISPEVDVKSLHPTEPGWNRRLM